MAAPKEQKSHEPVSEEMLQFIASRFKVLAEPMRLRILHSLQPGEKTVTQIIEVTEANRLRDTVGARSARAGSGK